MKRKMFCGLHKKHRRAEWSFKIDDNIMYRVCGIICCWPKDSHMMIILNNLSSPGSILSVMKYCGLIPTLYPHLSFHPQRTELHIQQHPIRMHTFSMSTHAHTHTGSRQCDTLVSTLYLVKISYWLFKDVCKSVLITNNISWTYLTVHHIHIQHFCNSSQYLSTWEQNCL